MKKEQNFYLALEEGQEVEGVVKNLTDYGAFIDLGGVDGLLHITDISWSRINHPSEALNIGEKIKVQVTKFDKDEGKVSLGIKQLSPDPWQGIENKFPLNTSVMAKVTNLTDYGFFAEIESGVEGLVHVSEIDWTNKNIHPSKVVELGDTLEVMILEVDEEKRRISLGVKQLTENPWQVFTHKYKEGDKIKGKIKSITDFGVFVGLEGDIDGLVHLSDVSWEDEEESIRKLERNEEIEAIVLSVDAERERISLGIKQLIEDSFNEFTLSNKKGTRVKGKVSEITDQKIFLNLTEEIKGYIPQKDFMNSSYNKDPELGDEIEVVIASINNKDREIILSLRALEKAEERDALRDNAEKNKEIEESSKSNLGDMIKAEIVEKEDE